MASSTSSSNDNTASSWDEQTDGNPFEVLGLTETSTEDLDEKTVKDRYHKLALVYHPDKNVYVSEKVKQENEETFKLIGKAYKFLVDRIKTGQKYRGPANAATTSSKTGKFDSYLLTDFKNQTAFKKYFTQHGTLDMYKWLLFHYPEEDVVRVMEHCLFNGKWVSDTTPLEGTVVGSWLNE